MTTPTDISESYNPGSGHDYIFGLTGDHFFPQATCAVAIALVMGVMLHAPWPVLVLCLVGPPTLLLALVGTETSIAKSKMRLAYASLKARGDLSEAQCRFLADETRHGRPDFTLDPAGDVRLRIDGYGGLEIVHPDGTRDIPFYDDYIRDCHAMYETSPST